MCGRSGITRVVLVFGALLIAVVVAVFVARLGRTFGPTEAIARWAAARGLAVRGDGVTSPLHVVGARAGRLFTLSLTRMDGVQQLLVAVDCQTAADGDQGALGGAAVQAGGEALAVRIQNPPSEVWDRLDGLVDELVHMAVMLEARAPGAEPDE
jgi:hypothetical protein